jgi:uncharacterized protein (TIGR03083 family)
MDEKTEPAITWLADTWGALSALGHELGDEEWLLPTDCPGWSVQDNLAHIVGLERMLQGHPQPAAAAEPGPHVRNDLGRLNEAWIDTYRGRSGAAVLEEFDIVAAERLAELAALSPADWDEPADTPAGRDTYRGFMGLRTFDSWVHEQDIRRATARPGHLDGPAAEHSVDHVAGFVPFVVAKRAGLPDGTVVRWDVTGPVRRQLTVAVRDGRGSHVEEDPPAATASITSDTETFICLLCGRWTAEQAARDSRVTLRGDTAAARSVLDHAGVMI